MEPSGGSWLADSFLVTKIINKLAGSKYRNGSTWMTCLVIVPVSCESIRWAPDLFCRCEKWSLNVFMINNTLPVWPAASGDIGCASSGHPGPGRGHITAANYDPASSQQLPGACSFINIKTDGASQNISSIQSQKNIQIFLSGGCFC